MTFPLPLPLPPWFRKLPIMAAAVVNWVYFLETWLKFLNNLTRWKVGYDETTGLYFMSGRIEIGYEVDELNSSRDVDKPTKRQTLRTTVFHFLDYFSFFSCPSISLHSRLSQSLFLLMRTIHEFPRQFFRTRCWFCVDVRMNGVEWMVLEFDWNPTMHDIYTRAFIESTSEWTSRTLHILSFMTKRNTRFGASLSIEKRELWHLETVKRSRSTAVLFGKCTSCSGHGLSVKVPCKLDWYGIADT